jgi:OmpA-OmpF porin, OOP family
VIAQIAELWRQHPDWKRIRIEGHTCDLGSDEMNLALSQRRAAHARAALLQHGFDQSQIDAIGLGRSRPRAAGDSEVARQRNRRVEFVIEREFSEGSP